MTHPTRNASHACRRPTPKSAPTPWRCPRETVEQQPRARHALCKDRQKAPRRARANRPSAASASPSIRNRHSEYVQSRDDSIGPPWATRSPPVPARSSRAPTDSGRRESMHFHGQLASPGALGRAPAADGRSARTHAMGDRGSRSQTLSAPGATCPENSPPRRTVGPRPWALRYSWRMMTGRRRLGAAGAAAARDVARGKPLFSSPVCRCLWVEARRNASCRVRSLFCRGGGGPPPSQGPWGA